jgi:hypothetical protein
MTEGEGSNLIVLYSNLTHTESTHNTFLIYKSSYYSLLSIAGSNTFTVSDEAYPWLCLNASYVQRSSLLDFKGTAI